MNSKTSTAHIRRIFNGVLLFILLMAGLYAGNVPMVRADDGGGDTLQAFEARADQLAPENGEVSAALAAVYAIEVRTCGGSGFDPKTSYTSGDAIKWAIGVINSSTSGQPALLSWFVKNPNGTVLLNYQETRTIQPGAWWWYLKGTIPNVAGTYTFKGSLTYQGVKKTFTTWYSVDHLKRTFWSSPTYDGFITESSETSESGGALNTAAATLRVGDNGLNRQYRSILSFNTAGLPDYATVTGVTLRLRQAAPVGGYPFSTLGYLLIDIKTGPFNGRTGLQAADWQDVASKEAVITVPSSGGNGYYSYFLQPADLGFINKTGPTQFRLRFSSGDNDNFWAEYLRFYSGNYTANPLFRPRLLINYDP